MMRTIIRHCLLAVLYIFLISCTFNYRDEALSGDSARDGNEKCRSLAI